LLEKKLNFKNITIVEVPAALASGIISISLAFNGFGIWSLVFGSLCGSLITVIILWKINTWRPLFKFSYAHFKELFSYGSHVTGSMVLYYVGGRMDSLVIGKFFGPILLGYYTIANILATIPQQKISWVVMRVTFPAFSTIQDNNEFLREAYCKVVKYISLITFPMLAGMFAVAPEYVTVFYGMRWAPMVIPLQILCLAGTLMSVDIIGSSILFSQGRVDIVFKLQLFFAIVMPIAVIAGAKYSIIGVASAITIMALSSVLISQIIANKLIGLNMYICLEEIFPAMIGSIILIIIIEMYKGFAVIYNIEIIYILLSSIFIGIMTYLIIMRLFFSYLFNEMKLLIHEMRRPV
jgi:O-antigen/teichoic acid export membrane protein